MLRIKTCSDSKLTQFFSGVRFTQSLVLCVCFVDRCLSFYPFSFGHCVRLPFTDYDDPFGIFKLFLDNYSYTLVPWFIYGLYHTFSI